MYMNVVFWWGLSSSCLCLLFGDGGVGVWVARADESDAGGCVRGMEGSAFLCGFGCASASDLRCRSMHRLLPRRDCACGYGVVHLVSSPRYRGRRGRRRFCPCLFLHWYCRFVSLWGGAQGHRRGHIVDKEGFWLGAWWGWVDRRSRLGDPSGRCWRACGSSCGVGGSRGSRLVGWVRLLWALQRVLDEVGLWDGFGEGW